MILNVKFLYTLELDQKQYCVFILSEPACLIKTGSNKMKMSQSF